MQGTINFIHQLKVEKCFYNDSSPWLRHSVKYILLPLIKIVYFHDKSQKNMKLVTESQYFAICNNVSGKVLSSNVQAVQIRDTSL